MTGDNYEKNEITDFCFIFVFIFFASCATQSETATPSIKIAKATSTKKPRATATAMVRKATNTPASSRGSSSTSGPHIDTVVDIPSYNETAPSGIYEQLLWAGRGGPGETPTPDHRCNGCSITENDYDKPNPWFRLESFNSRQKLRLVFYRGTGEGYAECGIFKYVTSSIVQVDNDGALTISLNGSTNINHSVILSVAFDVNTGKMVWQNPSAPYGNDYVCSVDTTSSCPGAPPQRLQVGKMAYVCTAKDSVKLRSGPGKSYDALKSLVPGADITVIGGPKCANNWSWWQVKTESGYKGWITEGGDRVDKYFLCPK